MDPVLALENEKELVLGMVNVGRRSVAHWHECHANGQRIRGLLTRQHEFDLIPECANAVAFARSNDPRRWRRGGTRRLGSAGGVDCSHMNAPGVNDIESEECRPT